MITATYKGKRYEVEYSVVNVSELEGALRLDAEYYERSYAVYINKVKNCNFSSLKELQKVPTVNGFDYRKFSDTGVPYVRVGDIKNFTINLDNSVRVNPKIIPQKIALKKDDILLTRKGTVGEIGLIYSENLKNVIISSEIMRLRLDKEKINPYFVAVFLNSLYGTAQIRQSLHGLAFVSITQDALENIKIPILSDTFQKQIQNLVLQSYDEKEKSVSLYKKAKDTLLEELGLKDWKPKTKKIFVGGKEYEEEENISIRNLSEVLKADRIDAEYFQPAYEEVSKKIKEYPNGFSRLLKHVENVNPNFDPTKYPEQTFSYVELADIDSSIGVIHSVNELKGEDAPSRARRMLKEGDVIVSSVEGSLEKVALVDKEHDGCLASTGFFQFRPLDILSEVLLVLSKTIVLQSQLKKKCSGTILTAVPKESLRDIIIPMFPLSTQQKIASLVQQSHEARKKAKELLKVAKKAVEIAIENNEKEALSYISKAESKQ